jgi:predicted nucleotidyltransferase
MPGRGYSDSSPDVVMGSTKTILLKIQNARERLPEVIYGAIIRFLEARQLIQDAESAEKISTTDAREQ